MKNSAALTQGKRQQNKEANRAAILFAARQCFLELGYDAVTVRDVVRRTDLAAGTFYNYFSDTESLFRAVLDEPMQRMTAHLHTVRSEATSIEEFLSGAYSMIATEVQHDREFFALLFRNEPIVRGLFDDQVLGLSMRTLSTDLRDAIARGVFPAVDVEALAHMLFAAGYEMARLMVAQPKRKAEDSARFVTGLFLHGIRNIPSGETAVALIRKGPIKLKGAGR